MPRCCHPGADQGRDELFWASRRRLCCSGAFGWESTAVLVEASHLFGGALRWRSSFEGAVKAFATWTELTTIV